MSAPEMLMILHPSSVLAYIRKSEAYHTHHLRKDLSCMSHPSRDTQSGDSDLIAVSHH